MIKGTNKYRKIGEMLEGVFTAQTLGERLKISKAKAVYVIYRLRKLGLVKTSYGAGKKRLYTISLKNKQRGISYTEKINEVSPIQLASSNPYYVHGRVPSYEEALIYALKQRNVRYTIASMALFRKISNWGLLYNLAKKEGLIREVVALYEVSRRVVRKVKKMPKRFINLAKKEKARHFTFVVDNISSDDFKDIEKKWKIFIPLNSADLEDYGK